MCIPYAVIISVNFDSCQQKYANVKFYPLMICWFFLVLISNNIMSLKIHTYVATYLATVRGKILEG